MWGMGGVDVAYPVNLEASAKQADRRDYDPCMRGVGISYHPTFILIYWIVGTPSSDLHPSAVEKQSTL